MTGKTRLLAGLTVLILAAIACNTPGSLASTTAAEPTQSGLPTSAPAPTQAPASQPTASLTTGAAPTTAPAQSPQRISFAAGGTSATVTGSVDVTHMASYVINVGKGQTMTVAVTASGGTVGLSVSSASGDVMKHDAVGDASWSGVLPQTGDYYLSVVLHSGGPATFTLQVTIPPLAQAGGGSNVQCWVTTATALTAKRESSPTADDFGQASVGEQTLALARTTDGWLGFDPGVAQAGNQGRARLRWYATQGASLTFDPAGCDKNLPLALSMQSLRNGTYHVNGMQDVKLTNGSYAAASFDPAKTGDSVHDTQFGSAYAFGDLNGDGSEDALIVLGTNTGGTGTFVEIFPVLNVNGNPQPGGSITVGDRTPVNDLSIDDKGVITADVTVQGPGDGMCCASLKQTWTIKLVNGALVKQ